MLMSPLNIYVYISIYIYFPCMFVCLFLSNIRQNSCSDLDQRGVGPRNILLSGKLKQCLNTTLNCLLRLIFCMQTQNYVYYMHFLVFNESDQSARARALFVKKCDFFDSKSMLTSLIALEHFSWHSLNKYALKKFTLTGLNVRARAQ